jgi:hypothetical protein
MFSTLSRRGASTMAQKCKLPQYSFIFKNITTFTPHRSLSTLPTQLKFALPKSKLSPTLFPRSTIHKSTIQTTPRRNMGIGTYFTEKIEGKKMEMTQHKERESYRHLRDYLISTPKFRFKEQLAYYEALQARVGKTDRLIGGQDVKMQEEMMKKKIDMFRSMSPLELLYESPGALNMTVKSRISVATGIDRKVIDTDLKQFDEMKTMHTWLHRLLKNGKSLPEDSVEMQKLMAEDPPPPSYQQIKMLQKARQNSRRTPR